MLTNGTIRKSSFGSFKELAAEIHRADMERAKNLARTAAARKANRERKAAKA